MTFAVKPEKVRALGEQFSDLATTVPHGHYNVETDMNVESVEGTLLKMIAAEIRSVRTDLQDVYEPGGTLATLFNGASGALRGAAREYETVDDQARADLDAKLPSVEKVDAPWTNDAAGVDVDAYRDTYAPVDIDHSEGVEALADAFNLDLADRRGRAEDSFDAYNSFVDIAEGIDYVISFDWLTESLGLIGLPDPLKEFKETLDGDWKALGRALGALDLVVSQERALASDLDGMIKHTASAWQGNAANACMTWINATSDKISGHASDLSSIGSRITAEALALKSGVDTACTAIDTLVGLVPNPKDFVGDGLLDTVVSVVKGGLKFSVSAITRALKAFKLAFDAIMFAGTGIVALCSQITRFKSSEWPSTPALDLPDVNGTLA